MPLVCSLVLLSAQLSAASESGDESALLKVQSVASKPLPARPEEMARLLTSGLEKDEDKLAVIQCWVVEVLAYDYEGLSRGQAIYDPITCYKNGRGVCQAIAGLYILMAQSVGVSVEEVTGTARDLSVTAKGPKSTWEAHAWVQYRGKDGVKWIDPTFSLPGSIKGKVKPGLGWFLLNPNLMALSHRTGAERSGGRSLASSKDIDLLPRFDLGALRQHQLALPVLTGDLQLDGRIGFNWSNTGKAEFIARIRKAETSEPSGQGGTTVLHHSQGARFYFTPKGLGWHEITVFVRKKSSREPFRSLCTIPFNTESAPQPNSEPVPMPLLYSDFKAMGVEIVSGGEVGQFSPDDDLVLQYRMKAEGTLVLFPRKAGSVLISELKSLSKNSIGVWEFVGRLSEGEWILGARAKGSSTIKFLASYRSTKR